MIPARFSDGHGSQTSALEFNLKSHLPVDAPVESGTFFSPQCQL
jgi:hypothetical protein